MSGAVVFVRRGSLLFFSMLPVRKVQTSNFIRTAKPCGTRFRADFFVDDLQKNFNTETKSRKGRENRIMWIWIILAAIVAAAIGAFAGYQYRKNEAEKKIGRNEEFAKKLLDDAVRKADEYKKEKVLEAKEEILKAKAENDRVKAENDKEMRERRSELQRTERRLIQREETLDKKADNMEAREESLNRKASDIQKLQEETEALRAKQITEL